MNDPSADVDDLRARSLVEDRNGRTGEAVRLLDEAVAALESHLGRIEGDAPATEAERRVASELAETYGLLGGIHRRRGALEHAVAAYDRGRSYEAADRYQLESTYASLNWVVTSVIADPASLEGEGEVAGELGRLRRGLARRTEGSEAFDPWLEGDVALAAVLSGESGEDAWRSFLRSAPVSAVEAYAATIAKLSELDTPCRAALVASLTALQGRS